MLYLIVSHGNKSERVTCENILDIFSSTGAAKYVYIFSNGLGASMFTDGSINVSLGRVMARARC